MSKTYEHKNKEILESLNTKIKSLSDYESLLISILTEDEKSNLSFNAKTEIENTRNIVNAKLNALSYFKFEVEKIIKS